MATLSLMSISIENVHCQYTCTLMFFHTAYRYCIVYFLRPWPLHLTHPIVQHIPRDFYSCMTILDKYPRHIERSRAYVCQTQILVHKKKLYNVLIASSPGSPPPLCFICMIIWYTWNVRLNIGGGEAGRLWSRVDTDDAFSVAWTIHMVDTERIISVHTWSKLPRLSPSDV